MLNKNTPKNAKGFAAEPPQGETRPPAGQRPAQQGSLEAMNSAPGRPKLNSLPLGGQRPAQRWSVGATLPRDTRDTPLRLESE